MPSSGRLYLIDGSSQMYRAYHAIRGLTGPDGRSTNAVYGFVTMLRKLLADHRPELIAAAFDLAGPTFRDEIAPDYKANRAPMPPDLADQIPLVHEACEALGVPIYTHERYEADDVLGTIAAWAAEAGHEVALVTGDKDFFQLVTDRIKVYNPRDDGTWFDAAGVKEKFGVWPAQVVDVLALMGDAIDNVKGVPGIGEKGARGLIATWGSLDDLLANASSLPQKKYREALLAHADSARQSRELVRIRTDVPIDVRLEAFQFRGASRERCFDLFGRLGFRSLTAEYAPTAATVVKDYARVATAAALEQLVADVREAGRVALHVISDEAAPLGGSIVGIAFSTGPRAARYVSIAPGRPCETTAGESTGLFGGTPPEENAASEDRSGFAPEVAFAHLRPLLEDPAILKTGHDLKFATLAFARAGITIAGLADDTMLASYVHDATKSGHQLDVLALERLGYKTISEEEVRGKGARAVTFRAVLSDKCRDFAGERADLAGQLAPGLLDDLDKAGLEPVYRELEMPLIPVLADIERAGVRLDGAVLSSLAGRVDAELAARSRRIHELAGTEFNINSPRQLSEVLFERLQLPITKKTGKTRTASTAVEVLEELALVHELPREILEWRALQKLKGTYIDALPLLMDPVTGRVHTSFNQAVAATGRLSSSDPNLQNIPIRTGLGREIRRAFVADDGCLLISADYSQIELRVLAHLSGDEHLTEAFRRGDDIHDRTSLAVFGADSGLDRYELRRRAKIINYALLYGKTAFTLAKDIGVTQQAAQAFIDAYFAGFPGVRRFIEETLARARETGVVTTMFGRRRLVPDLTNRNGQVRAAAERVTVNLPIQGTAADILKRAMLGVHAALSSRPARGNRRTRMILTVHDELLFEAPEEDAEQVAGLVRDQMEQAAALSVPLTVDVGMGRSWRDAK